MARYTYVGRLTDARRTRFTSSFNARLFVQPAQAGYGATGLISDRRIPVTVDADTGDFSVALEASGSVRPPMLYEFGMEWQESGVNYWSVWSRFRAHIGGGNISDMLDINTPSYVITHGYGPPPEYLSEGIYIDRSGTRPRIYAAAEGLT